MNLDCCSFLCYSKRMEYKRKLLPDRVLVTSVLKGPDAPRRIIGGRIITAEVNSDQPLVRVYSKRKLSEKGNFLIAYKDGDWKLFNYRFPNLKRAEACLEGLHLEYDELAIVQVYSHFGEDTCE